MAALAPEGLERPAQRRRRRQSIKKHLPLLSAAASAQLPFDVLLTMASQLDLPDILSLCGTNQHFARVCAQDAFWQTLIRQQFGSRLLADANVVPAQTWLQVSQTRSHRQLYLILWTLDRILTVVDFFSSWTSAKWHTHNNRWVSDIELEFGAEKSKIIFGHYAGHQNKPTKEQCADIFDQYGWHESRVGGGGYCGPVVAIEFDPVLSKRLLRRSLAAFYWDLIIRPRPGPPIAPPPSILFTHINGTKEEQIILPFRHDANYLTDGFVMAFQYGESFLAETMATKQPLSLKQSKASSPRYLVKYEIRREYGEEKAGKPLAFQETDVTGRKSSWSFHFLRDRWASEVFLLVPQRPWYNLGDLRHTELDVVMNHLLQERHIRKQALRAGLEWDTTGHESYVIMNVNGQHMRYVIGRLCEALVDTTPLLTPEQLTIEISVVAKFAVQDIVWPVPVL